MAKPPSAARSSRRTAVLAAALVGLLGATAWLLNRTADCDGGDITGTEELAELGSVPGIPDTSTCNQIDPDVIPHVELARLTFVGNQSFALKCDHGWGHIHPRNRRRCDPARQFDGNAFFHAPSRDLGGGDYEVVTTIAIAYPKPMPAAYRDGYFPNGRCALVSDVVEGGEADKQGLKAGDAVASMDGAPLRGGDPDGLFVAAVKGLPVGEELALEVIRDGALARVTLTRHSSDLFNFRSMTAPVVDVTP